MPSIIQCAMKLLIRLKPLTMPTYFHPTLYWGCDYLSMLGFNVNHVSKSGPCGIHRICGDIVALNKYLRQHDGFIYLWQSNVTYWYRYIFENTCTGKDRGLSKQVFIYIFLDLRKDNLHSSRQLLEPELSRQFEWYFYSPVLAPLL